MQGFTKYMEQVIEQDSIAIKEDTRTMGMDCRDMLKVCWDCWVFA